MDILVFISISLCSFPIIQTWDKISLCVYFPIPLLISLYPNATSAISSSVLLIFFGQIRHSARPTQPMSRALLPAEPAAPLGGSAACPTTDHAVLQCRVHITWRASPACPTAEPVATWQPRAQRPSLQGERDPPSRACSAPRRQRIACPTPGGQACSAPGGHAHST